MQRSNLLILLALFYAVFLICAGLLQLRSGFPPTKGGSAVDQFNAAMLWVTSVIALLIASERAKPAWKVVFWLAVSAGFGALAIDETEVIEFHEATRHSWGDDDYIKMLAWSCAGIGAYTICRVALPTRAVAGTLAIAFAFQTLWLLSDLGDGDFFTVPIALVNLQWLEEYFEILASQFYLTALILHFQDLRSPMAAQDPRGQFAQPA
jgi:hypothetical protein